MESFWIFANCIYSWLGAPPQIQSENVLTFMDEKKNVTVWFEIKQWKPLKQEKENMKNRCQFI